MTIQERIRKARKEKGLTQKQLADLLAVTQSSVGQYETNEEPPKLATLLKISKALDVAFPYLIGTTDVLSGWYPIVVKESDDLDEINWLTEAATAADFEIIRNTNLIIGFLRRLSKAGIVEAAKRVEDLTYDVRYKKND